MSLKLFLSLAALVLVVFGVISLVVPTNVLGVGASIWLWSAVGTKILEWFIDQLRAEYPNLGRHA